MSNHLKRVAIPSPSAVADKQVRTILEAVKQNVEILDGTRGGILDRALRTRDLRNIGMIAVAADNNTLYDPNAPGPSGFSTANLLTGATVEANEFVVLDATSGLAIGSHLLSLQIPVNAYIVRAWYEVTTTFTSAANTAKIALGIETDDVGGIVFAIAINDPSLPWNAGLPKDCIQNGAAVNFAVKTTGYRKIQADVAGEALTNGRLKLFVEYVVT